MSDFRFLHAADIHLDSPLVGLSGVERGVAEQIRAAPRAAFEALIARAIEDSVAFLVIAGDLYDGTWRDYRTGLFFAEQMGRLNAAGIPAYVLHGNHDAESQITKPLPLPDNVHVFGARKPQTFLLEELGVALHGQSFRQKAVEENLAAGYPEPAEGAFNIGVLHTALGGAEGHDNYAPCSIQELAAKGYDYWALGHVHQHRVRHEHPPIVFPGNIQGRHIRETGPKGACLVAVEAHHIRDITLLPFATVRWEALEVDAAAANNIDEVVDLMQQELVRARADADEPLVAARIVLRGSTALHDGLLAEADGLLEQARAGAAGLGDSAAWVERVAVRTEPAVEQADVPDDLHALLAAAAQDPELLRAMEREFGKFRSKLQRDVRARNDDAALAAAADGDYAALIAEVRPYLRARLAAGEP